jgi:hypothetical protein
LRSISCVLLLALAIAPSPIASAQTVKPAARTPTATVPATTTTPAVTPDAKPAPCDCPSIAPQRHYPAYTAKQESTRVQTLADGTKITTVTESETWRDANGRTRTDTTSTKSAGTVTQFVSVYDPLNRVRMSWNIGNPAAGKVVTLYRYPQPVQPTAPPSPASASAQRYYPFKSESLPPQTIAGIYVTGTRSARTIPAGYEGNDRDMTTTTESWFSPDLGIQMRTVMDDPRNGKTTTEVTGLQQTAPDPSLFEAPQGYTVR